MGLLDLIAAPSPERAKQTLADLVRGPQNRLRGLLDSPVNFLTDALNDVVPTGQQAAEQLQRYQLPMSQDYAMGPSGYDNKLKDMALAGLTVYHGSPHKFDKFDINKIGTGEGAQAYGHGLYFAEAQDVAKSYADALTKMRVQAAQSQLKKYGGNVDDAIAASRKEIDRLKSLNLTPATGAAKRDSLIAGQEEKLSELIAYKNQGSMNQGQMYKVDIPDEAIAKMLDWDKPLSQQSKEVQAAMRSAFDDMYGGAQYGEKNFNQAQGMTGGELVNFFRNREAASQVMNGAGIPGIRYLDGSSRSAGSGTSNFVVFDDSLLKILERNGMPVP